MSEQKVWVDSSVVEVTKSVTEQIDVNELKLVLERKTMILTGLQQEIKDLENKIAELEATPNRPVEPVVEETARVE